VGTPRNGHPGRRGERRLEAGGTKELLEIVGDFLIQTVQLGALLRMEFGVGLDGPKQPGSVVSWQHINLLGGYDFSDEKLQIQSGSSPQN
jgi:hypothetical protein